MMMISHRVLVFSATILMVLPALIFSSPSTSAGSTASPSSISRPGRADQQAAIAPPARSPEAEEPVETIADPLEPVNRVFFHFNDRLYFWVLKPVATGYKTVFPEPFRVGIKNFFSNLMAPVRMVNCLLQGNLKGAGNETIRVTLNTTLGLAGFLDPAKKELKIEKQEEDLGQTLGVWGMGPLLYIEWPILGASSARDTLGYIGDRALDPQTYLITSIPVNLAVKSYEEVNDTSLRIGDYEDFKKAAVDPYIAKRDAYHQYRQHKTKERGKTEKPSGGQRKPGPPRSLSAQIAHLDLPLDNSFYSY